MEATREKFLIPLVLLVLLFASYSNSFRDGFHFDDFHQIVENPNIRSLGNIPAFFYSAEMGSVNTSLRGYRPVTYASFALSYALSGYSPGGYRLFNLLIHFLNALLVYVIVRLVSSARGGDGGGEWAAFLAAAAFALHPVQTNAVTYISGRAVLLASFFSLASFYCFLRFRRGGGYAWGAASPVLFLLGLLSKEMAVALPGLMLAYDLLMPRAVPRKKRAWPIYIPLAAALIGFLFIKRVLEGFVVEPSYAVGPYQYLLAEARAFLIYLRLAFLPINLNWDYYLPLPKSFNGYALVSGLLVLAACIVLFRLRRRDPAVSFFGFWFLIALAPESSIIPIPDTVVEYRLYLPLAGLLAAASVYAGRLVVRRPALKGMALAAIALAGVLTFARNEVWATELTLWQDVVKKSPWSPRAHFNLGKSYLDLKMYDEASAELVQVVHGDAAGAISPELYIKIGSTLTAIGKYREATEVLERAVAADPGSVAGWTTLAEACYRAGLLDKASLYLSKALNLDPEYPPARLLSREIAGNY